MSQIAVFFRGGRNGGTTNTIDLPATGDMDYVYGDLNGPSETYRRTTETVQRDGQPHTVFEYQADTAD